MPPASSRGMIHPGVDGFGDANNRTIQSTCYQFEAEIASWRLNALRIAVCARSMERRGDAKRKSFGSCVQQEGEGRSNSLFIHPFGGAFGFPASTLRIKRRGTLAPGYFTDVVVFDSDSIQNHAT